jgi:hypothetical protein
MRTPNLTKHIQITPDAENATRYLLLLLSGK